jgi:hypothetical protein
MPQIQSIIAIKPSELKCFKCSRPATFRVAIEDGACIVGVSCCADCVNLPAMDLLNSADYYTKEQSHVQSIPR